jgi:hypothetical protein
MAGDALRIPLTPQEQALFDSISSEASREGTFSDEYGGNVAELLKRLQARNAIPAVRLRYFTNADLNPGVRKSRRQVFIDNGCGTPDKINTSGNFFRHLEYFICGPRVPAHVIARFQEYAATAFRDFETLRSFVRAQVNRLNQQSLRGHVGDEFLHGRYGVWSRSDRGEDHPD